MIGRYRDGSSPTREAEPELASDLAGAPKRVTSLLDEAELTQALEEIWKLVRRLNQYVEETKPWELAKDESAAERLDSVLYGLAEGLRVTPCSCMPTCPRRPGGCWTRSVSPAGGWTSSARAAGARPWASSHRSSRSSRPPDLRGPESPLVGWPAYLGRRLQGGIR